MVDCCFSVTIAKHSRQELDENNSRKRCPGGLICRFNRPSSLSITSKPSRIHPMLCCGFFVQLVANHENVVSTSFAKEQSYNTNYWISYLISFCLQTQSPFASYSNVYACFGKAPGFIARLR
jgi:hypothetical protein